MIFEGMNLTEYQRASLDFLDNAIKRMYQEGLSVEEVVYLFLKLTNDDVKSVGLRLYIGPANK